MSASSTGRRTFIAGAGASALLASTAKWRTAGAAAERPPNIVFIMADDLGYADLSCYGRRDYTTRHIDRLARQGLKLNHSYANSPVCSPTRFGLMTGRYQYRLPGGLEEPISEGDGAGLPPDHPTLPSLLKDVGYHTVLVGKWHLGFLPNHSPLKSGYDTFFGILPGGADYFTHSISVEDGAESDLYEGEVPVDRIGYMTDLLGERAVAEIEKGAKGDTPLFLSLHFTAPHWPWEGPEDKAVSEQLRSIFHNSGGSLETFGEMVTSLDRNVGRVLKALDDTGLAENTIVVFTSDNGGERFSDVWPLIGMKGEVLEGGIRVPTIIRWPGHTKPGRESDQVMISMDWMPTFLRATGTAPHPDYPPDGVDLLDVLTGSAAVQPRKLYWRFGANDQRAHRDGRWKYVRMSDDEYLFDIVADPRERANKREVRPDLFARLKADYEAWNADMLPYSEDDTSFDNEDSGYYADRY